MEQCLKKLRVKNLLSFGKEGIEIEFQPLNVFIGANGSGKSNFIEILKLIRSLPTDLASYIRNSGGIGDIIWKGDPKEEGLIDLTVKPNHPQSRPTHHRLSIAAKGQSFEISDEVIDNNEQLNESTEDVELFYHYDKGRPKIASFGSDQRIIRPFGRGEELDIRQSILSQRKDPVFYPELGHLSSMYNEIRVYNDWCFGSNSSVRKPQKTDLPEDFLLETGENLGLVLNDIEHQTRGRENIQHYMNELFEDYEDYSIKIHAGTVQVCLKEKGLLSPVPANRLSDGTLRYLSLLAILCHPKPPQIICIEEPELGLHPDMIGQIAQLAVEASSRTQLFVTTHSEIFIDALSDYPSSIFIVEKINGESKIHQEDSQQIAKWLESYTLGQLWRKGEIGGNRW